MIKVDTDYRADSLFPVGSIKEFARPDDLWRDLDRFRRGVTSDPRFKDTISVKEISSDDMKELEYSRTVRNAVPENLISDLMDLSNIDFPIERLPNSLKGLLSADGVQRKFVKRVLIHLNAPRLKDGIENNFDLLGGEIHLDDGLVVNFDLAQDEMGEVSLDRLDARGSAVLKGDKVILDNKLSDARNSLFNQKLSEIRNDPTKSGNILGGIGSLYNGINTLWHSRIDGSGSRFILKPQ